MILLYTQGREKEEIIIEYHYGWLGYAGAVALDGPLLCATFIKLFCFVSKSSDRFDR